MSVLQAIDLKKYYGTEPNIIAVTVATLELDTVDFLRLYALPNLADESFPL